MPITRFLANPRTCVYLHGNYDKKTLLYLWWITICMCVCVCVCKPTCIHFMGVCLRVWLHIMSLCVCVCVCECVDVCVYVCMCVCVYVCVYLYVWMCDRPVTASSSQPVGPSAVCSSLRPWGATVATWPVWGGWLRGPTLSTFMRSPSTSETCRSERAFLFIHGIYMGFNQIHLWTYHYLLHCLSVMLNPQQTSISGVCMWPRLHCADINSHRALSFQ